jgi:predicted DNA-binding transcriptional regulator
MAPVRVDRSLIDKQQQFLEKIENQGRSWAVVVAGSICCLLVALAVLLVIEKAMMPMTIVILMVFTMVLCLVWLGWTITFIFRSVKDQKIIYQLLDDISHDIEVISKELSNSDVRDIDQP